jgi:hypothetical protein
MIDESQIPMPETQYEMPESLIGEFIMISPAFNHEMFIFPNNKYIARLAVPNHMTADSYGYVIQKITTGILHDLREIIFAI